MNLKLITGGRKESLKEGGKECEKSADGEATFRVALLWCTPTIVSLFKFVKVKLNTSFA